MVRNYEVILVLSLSLSPDQLQRDEEMAAALHAQYLNEESHHPLSPPRPHPLSPHSPHPLSPHSPHPHYSPHISHSPSPAPQPDDNNLLNEQLQFEERAGVRGQPTMVLYNYAVNGGGRIDPRPSFLDEVPSQATPPELEGEKEWRRQPSLPSYYSEEERRRRREWEEEEEEEILIPCDVCGASIRFEDYQKHMVYDLESYCNLMCSIKILGNFKNSRKWKNKFTNGLMSILNFYAHLKLLLLVIFVFLHILLVCLIVSFYPCIYCIVTNGVS